MARQPKKIKQQSDKEWLQSEPEQSEVEISPMGGYHIPIDKLRPLLDRLNATVSNYRCAMYKSYADTGMYGSLELTVVIDGKERTVTGAYNLIPNDLSHPFWNGTLKSECVKNAAIELGKRFGRELNIHTPKQEPTQVGNMVSERLKAQPDDKIMQQYKSAVERGDEAAISTLRNIYEIKTD